MQPKPTRTVLLVDDEPMIRKALQRSLRGEGYQFFTASDPTEALAVLKAQPIDLLLSDHLMPGMTGLELCTLARERYPDMVRIMLTGHADLSVAVAGINNEAIHRFITKPWDDLELKVTLQLAFERLDVERDHRRLLAMVRRQYDLLRSIEERDPGLAQVVRDAEGSILLDAEPTDPRARYDLVVSAREARHLH